MAALTATALTYGGVQAAPAAVATTDTIAESQFGANGVILRVINGAGSPMTLTVSDPNLTAVGNAGTTTAVSITNATSKTFFIPRAAINQSTGLCTLTYSSATTVTYELYRV